MFQNPHRLLTKMMNHKLLVACCLGFTLFAASGQAAMLEHRSQPEVLAWLGNYQPEVVSADKRLPFPALMDALGHNRVVFVGETHDRYDHHLNQLAILQALHQRNPRLAIGVEWFQQPFQPVVDDFLAGKIDENELLRRTAYFDRWRYDYRMLRPIMEYAKANHLPVIALNAPAELTRKVSHGGLQALSPAERAQLPASISPPDEAYRSRLAKIFAEHSGKQQLENFVQVQRIWDETMAQNISRFLQPNPAWQMVVFSGSGHISHGAGIPQDVAQQMPDIKLATVVSSDMRDIQPDMADYFILTRPYSLPPTGKLGVWLNTIGKTVQIGEMAAGSAAQKAGLQTGDRLASLDGIAITSMTDLMLTLAQYKPGQQVQVQVARAGETNLSAYAVTLQ
ncbi:MAG: ChaN family lipoprotein [Thiothrix sp.]|uniref:ChaN family lipoprotein n=1 Tax=Thiothrix sp. TaxID=1032 RepID=UPI0026246D11|nr:ChaN family lipoprotein [Thiothrix sp.]MDD5391716.1 ChaN family lipoprotein [Thiothrix sp.]